MHILRSMADGVRSTIHPENVSSKAQEQRETSTGQGTSGMDKGKARGRPRKETQGGNGFAVPTKPDVELEQPDKRVFTVIPHRAIHADISTGAFRTLALIASYANKNGFTWVGQQRLADEKGVTIQAISKHVQELKQAGLIEETAKAYWGGATPRTSTMRIIFDASMTDEDVIARAGSAEQVEPISREVLVDSTSFKNEVVNSRPEPVSATKQDLESQRQQLTDEVLARYRREGLEPPGKWRLAEEVAALASLKARGMA